MTHTPIKAGDTVICIDSTASFHRLEQGQQYTVDAAFDGSPVVIADGAYHSISRFQKIEAEGRE